MEFAASLRRRSDRSRRRPGRHETAGRGDRPRPARDRSACAVRRAGILWGTPRNSTRIVARRSQPACGSFQRRRQVATIAPFSWLPIVPEVGVNGTGSYQFRRVQIEVASSLPKRQNSTKIQLHGIFYATFCHSLAWTAEEVLERLPFRRDRAYLSMRFSMP